MWHQSAGGVCEDVQIAPDKIGQRGRRAFVGHMDHVNTGDLFEQLLREVRSSTDAL